jgi:hypothetical protein
MMEENNNAEQSKDFLSAHTIANRISQRSELAQEIISNKPDFLERWMLYIFSGILLLLLASTWFINYPDMIETKAVLTAQNGPEKIDLQQDGRLVKLFVLNGGRVRKNEVIGWMESTADQKEVMGLSGQVDKSIALLKANEPLKISGLFIQRYTRLGEIQPVYQKFINENSLENNDQLNNNITQHNRTFLRTLQTLKKQIDDWTSKYIIQSPINGTIAFTMPLQENQNLQKGQLLAYITPLENTYYVEATLSQYNLGKLKIGSPVQLRFDGYIADVSSENGFLATINLNNGLVTNNNQIIPYKKGLQAQAIIITKNMRLMERLYYSIVKSIPVTNK